MSKYDAYLALKPIVGKAIKNLNLALARKPDGTHDARNDKASFTFHAKQNCPNVFLIDLTYGYYGSSSGYSAMDEATSRYILMACNQLKADIANMAIKLAMKDLEEKKCAARDEAKSVLDVTHPTN